MRFLSVILSASFVVMGCRSNTSPPQVISWTHGQGAMPPVFASPQFSKMERPILVMGEVVRFSRQHWGPAIVEGGFLQMVDGQSGKPQFGKAQVAVSPLGEATISDEDIVSLYQNRFDFLANLTQTKILPPGFKVLAGPVLTLMPKGKLLKR